MNNEPAFPEVVTEWNHERDAYQVSSEGGMSLRDYFAAKAIQGFASSASECREPNWQLMAREAYVLADAMLKARNSQPERDQ